MTREAEFQNSSLAGAEKLLEMARDRSEGGRALLVTAVCDLIVDNEPDYSGREAALMDDILRRLIGEVEAEVRQDLAERLCTVASAPRELIVALANDQIGIAQSLLRNSPVLRDPDLVEIIRHRARGHQLAIAARQEIGESVSDALVGTDDVGVITTLLDNRSALISVLTLEYLVEQSERIDAFHQPLLHREELSDALAAKMYAWVSAALREHFAGRFDIPDGALEKAVDGAVSKAASTTRDSPPGGKAGELVDQLSRSDLLTPQGLIQVLREGEIPLFEEMFARFTGLEIIQIKKIIYEAGGQPLAVVCKASHLLQPDFASIFLLSRQARPGDKTVEPGELKRAFDFFNRIDVDKAEKILEKWRMRPEHSEASETVKPEPVSDHDVPTPRREHNAAQSTKILKPGRIVFDNGKCVIDCLVQEISESGAVLKPTNLLECPKFFTLNFGRGAAHSCEVCWRHGEKVGVRFLDT